MTPSLTVFVPALNERDTLASTVDHVLQALHRTVTDFEIIIVDDGSTDGTGEIADGLAARHGQIRVVHNPRNMGLGYSYLRAVDVASKTFFVYVPGDDTNPLPALVDLFGATGRTDVVASYPTNPEVRRPGRRIVSRWYTRVLNMLFNVDVRYYNGITIYPVTFLRSGPITTHGFGFQAEALLKAIDAGLSVSAIPLPIDERATSGSKAVTVKNILSVVFAIARLFWELRIVSRAAARAARTAGRR